MKLWVDYTNHRGVRAWRQIEGVSDAIHAMYPPQQVGDANTSRRWLPCICVTMIDRERARRTLALTSIHGFHIGDEPLPTISAKGAPTVCDPVVQAVRNDLLTRSMAGIEKYGMTLHANKLPLRDKLQHAYEEALDLSNYLKWSIMQLDEWTGAKVPQGKSGHDRTP